MIARYLTTPQPAAKARVVDCAGNCLAPGIVDIGVKVSEPGERHKESFRSAGRAAAAGGVTTIVTRPDTMPAIDTPETLEFVARRAARCARARAADGRPDQRPRWARNDRDRVFAGCRCRGLYRLRPRVTNTKVFSRALTYAKSLGALVIAHVQEPVLSDGAAVTSGKFASLRGLPAVSPMAERMALDRDIALLEMTGARYHADQITTARALPALERAKRNGLQITAGVGVHHLTLNELDVADYRTFFKLKPPLRSEDDRIAVVQAVAEG